MKTLTEICGSAKRCFSLQFQFVPKHLPPREEDIKILKHFFDNFNSTLVLTGAGISTESGIPDYRSEEVGLYARSNHKPIQYQEFVTSAYIKKRYWARNFVGWPRFSQCQPNHTHEALKQLEEKGKLVGVVTQNVDGLHYKAGSENVVELHGSSYRVHCIDCGEMYDRHDVQKEMEMMNVGFDEVTTTIRPDGDVQIPEEKIVSFNPPHCNNCGTVLKPDIVFFGDNVPKERVEKVRTWVTQSDSVLVLGSSLSVFSSYRIVLQAIEEGKEVCIVNIGPTRADKLVSLKISAKCGDLLPKLISALNYN